MGTRAAAFTAKIRSLQEFHTRIVNNSVPAPSATEICNTLKYFSQLLLGVLRDIPAIPIELIRNHDRDHARTSMFPNLDYKNLYFIIVQFLEILPQIQTGVQNVGQTILHTMSCLVPFLEHEYMDSLPYIVASAMATLPPLLHKELLDMLCYNLLPFTIDENSDESEDLNYANTSIPSIIMFVLNNADNPSFHTQLLECLMRIKLNVAKDLLCVIAYGSAKARCAAVELLFLYWPHLNPSALDRKALSEKHVCWTPLTCQYDNCQNNVNNEAVKMCIDHTIVMGSGERPTPLLICIECTDQIYRGRSRDTLLNILLPMEEISYNCENKSCKSPLSVRTAVATCFSIECSNYNCNKPIRYCHQCNEDKHSNKESANHIVHTIIPSPWHMDSETQNYLIEAIVSLLKEAQPDKPSKDGERHSRIGFQVSDDNQETTIEERQLLSRYGVWLLVGLCAPNEATPEPTLGRMLSMLCQWFHYTACLPDDQAGSALERLKADCIHGWLMKFIKTHFTVFTACLLPHPLDYARLGGHWESWPSQTNQIKEGFKRLLCLVPYDIITADVWGHIMPYWMECFRHDVPEEELSELKILLSKVLDPDLSPLGLQPKQMYQFISIRFDNTTAPIQDQALCWLQILTMLEVPVPLDLLTTMFSTGVKSLSDPNIENVCTMTKIYPEAGTCSVAKSSTRSHIPDTLVNDQEINLSCYILMLDILVKQFELQEVNSHKGLETKEAVKMLKLILDILRAPWVGTHTCRESSDVTEGEILQCLFCEMCAIWYQLTLLIIEYFCPVMEVTMADIPGDTALKTSISPHEKVSKSDSASSAKSSKGLQIIDKKSANNSTLDLKSVSNEANDSGLKSATIADVEENFEFSSIIPIEPTDTVAPRSVTTEEEVPSTKFTVQMTPAVDEDSDSVFEKKSEESSKNLWDTSYGKFKYVVDDLSPQEQLVFMFLQEVSAHTDPDVLYHLLYCLKLMSLHSEVLNKAAKNQRGFLIWCQENLLIPNLWKLLQSEFSQISQLCVPLILHCITLPAGSAMFAKVVEEDFHKSEWRARFAAVEKITTIAHFVEPATVKNSPLLQASLASAFCYLVHCLDDIEASVAQRALLNLEMIKTSSLKLLLWCLEVQFDLVIVDRPMILTTIFQLYNHLSDRRFLTWDFFLNRFDALFLEQQVHLERIGEISQTRDLRNTNVNSETYQKKLTRAQEALSHSHAGRSLSATFGFKLPYKRTISAPTFGLVQKFEKDKFSYGRQTTAPAISRAKSSKLAALTGSTTTHFPNSFFHDNQLKEAAQEESHLMNVIHKIAEVDDHDKDTIHLLIFLLMQFLSRPDPSHPVDEKSLTRSHVIVLRHLNILMGYSPSEKAFLVPPNSLRGLPVFNAFITSMPKVLDFNFKMGNILLTTCLPLLVYCPSPQRYIHDGNHLPVYSLWLLKPHVRLSWLMALNIILYKHSYNSQSTLKQIQMLIQVVMNTLEAQFHRCRPLNEHMQSPIPSRSRDLSTASVDLEQIQEQEQSIDSQGDDNDIYAAKPSETVSAFSSDADDEDKELEVIVQSPKSKVDKSECLAEEKAIAVSKDPKTDSPKSSSVPNDRPKDISEVKSNGHQGHQGELNSNKSELILPNNLEKSENISEMTDENDEKVIADKPTPYHPPVQRVSRQLSPKQNRHKIQRMEAIEGSVKLKKSKKESKESADKQSKLKEPEVVSHNSLTRIASADDRHLTQESGHKVVRNTNSSDSVHSKASKSTWTIEVHSPIKLQPILPVKPPQERLLPIGINTKELRTSKEVREDFAHYDKDSETKGVQTYKHLATSEGEMQYPVCERLLPIGPTPPFIRKEPILVSPLIQQKRSSIQMPVLKDEVIGTKCETSVPMPSVMSTTASNTSASHTSSTTIYAINTNQIVANKSPLTPRDSIDNIEVKPKPSNTPVVSGLTKTVKTSESFDSISSPKKEKITKSNSISVPKRESNADILESNEAILEKVVIEMPSVRPNIRTDKPEEPETQSSNVVPNKTSSEQKAVRYRQRKTRKGAATASDFQRTTDSRGQGVADKVSRRTGRPKKSKRTGSQSTASNTSSGQDQVYDRCPRCGNVLEQFSEEEIGMCVIILGTYVHREPALAAPILPEMLRLVSKYAGLTSFHWQNESNTHLPGSTASIARQFIRCTLHQLAPNGIFRQLFYAHFANPGFFKSITLALSDFVDLNQVSPLVELLQNLNERKHLPNISEMMHMLGNVATYLECISLETPSQQPWALFLPQLETFVRKVLLLLPNAGVLNLTPLMRIMISTVKLPIINTYKTIVDPFSKVLSHIIQQSPLLYEQLLELCNLCCRNFVRERDRYLLTRTVVVELIQAIKFRTIIPDENMMMLVQFILQDASGTLTPSVIVEKLKMNNTLEIENYSTSACECVRQNIMDLLEFVTDLHTVSRVKSNFLGTSIHLNEETLGGHLKAGISQYLSLEMTKNNGSDHRAITKYLPWLYSLPSLQQGPKEFIDCVAHIRTLSWLLLGSLQHSALLHNSAAFLCQPIPLEANTHIAEHIQVILAGFAEQSKASVLHMSSLFHAFILCQLWTMYCENISGQNPPGSDQYHQCTLTLSDFWAKITPGILQLICHSKVLAETVSLHFLNLMETLMECNSTMLSRLLPLWTPVFSSYKGQLSGNTQMRLQSVINWRVPPQTRDDAAMTSSTMIRWLHRMQTKMSMIEMQSSTAIQFYCI